MASAPPISLPTAQQSSDHDDENNHHGTHNIALWLTIKHRRPHTDNPPASKRARLHSDEAAQAHPREESPVTPPHEAGTGAADPLPYDGIPHGWRRCPPMGQPLRLPFTDPNTGREHKTYLVPMKVCCSHGTTHWRPATQVPLDGQYDDRLQDSELFYPEDAILTVATNTAYKRMPVRVARMHASHVT